ncbi:hypothetical protein MLD38_024555 [Melastoma candidum]|uniref:Uncharacterized protein n=1 Tax=Melastoma candidum TaxID=119954 RepID=A0ACB9NT19_9MYRT|nr:hypothetical protein MLD38_024555 [Melastoma candidum]
MDLIFTDLPTPAAAEKMLSFNYLLSSFPLARDVSAGTHASSANSGHGGYRADLLEEKTSTNNGGSNDDKKKRRKKKKGRETKIRTARGVRDRRVRLSMEVSRKFFGLQDALGFDTASDTIEWLISESGNAIEEVKISNEVPVTGSCSSPGGSATACDLSRGNCAEKDARRECRARARARARERTEAKRNHNNSDGCSGISRSDFFN